MKKIIFLLPMIFLSITTFSMFHPLSVINKQSDSVTAGQSFYIDVQIDDHLTMPAIGTDSLDLYIESSYSGGNLLNPLVVENYYGWQGTHPGQSYINAYTNRFTFTVSSTHLGWIYFRGATSAHASDSVFVCSATNDVVIIGPIPASGYNGDVQNVNFKWTYSFATTDSLKIFFNGIKQGSVSLYNKKSTSLSYTINASAGIKSVSFTNYSGTYSFNVLSTTTGILDPLSSKIAIVKYYNIQGEEIQKPTEGFFIWKSENGSSGKTILTY